METDTIVPAAFETGDPLDLWENAPPEWSQDTLWNLAKYINGSAFKPSDFTSDGLRIIKITELKYGVSADTALYNGSYEQKHLLRTGDLLFAWSGNPETSVDAFRWRDGEGLLNQHIFRIVPRDGIDKTYFYFLLKFLRPTFIRTARDKATSMGHVKVSDLKRLIAWIPPLPEQRAIAGVLGALDDKIELNRQMNETLEALARAFFKAWFVDAIEADLPSGWCKAKLRDCCDRVENGGTPKRSESRYWEPPTIPWLTSGEVRQAIVTKTENMLSEEGLANSSAKLWPAATTVVALYGATAGQVCLLGGSMCANQACCGLIPKEDMRYVIYLHASSSVAALEQQARGSAQQNLSQQIVADFPIAVPSAETLAQFDEAVHPLFARWIANIEESRTLAALRDALLPKLLSGAVRVKDGEHYDRELKGDQLWKNKRPPLRH